MTYQLNNPKPLIPLGFSGFVPGLHLVMDVPAWFFPPGKYRAHRPGRLQDDDARMARLRGPRPRLRGDHVPHGVQFHGGGRRKENAGFLEGTWRKVYSNPQKNKR